MRAFFSTRSLVDEISHSHGFAARLCEYRLQRRWREIAGDVVAAHTWPARITFRKLHVSVENSVWLHELMYLKAALLENIQAAMSEPRLQDIIFRIGDIPATPARAAAVDDRIHVTPDARIAAAACAQGVQDTDLREALTRVIATALSVSRHRQKP